MKRLSCSPSDQTLIRIGWFMLAFYVGAQITATTLFLFGLISDTVLLVLNLELSFIALVEARIQFLLQSYVKRDVNNPEEGTSK